MNTHSVFIGNAIGDVRVYRKGCTGARSTFNFARRFERRPSRFAERVARAFDESLTLQGVFNVDSHSLPKGLHGRSPTFRLSKGRLRRNPTFQEDLGKPFSQELSQKYMFRARLSFKSQKEKHNARAMSCYFLPTGARQIHDLELIRLPRIRTAEVGQELRQRDCCEALGSSPWAMGRVSGAASI